MQGAAFLLSLLLLVSSGKAQCTWTNPATGHSFDLTSACHLRLPDYETPPHPNAWDAFYIEPCSNALQCASLTSPVYSPACFRAGAYYGSTGTLSSALWSEMPTGVSILYTGGLDGRSFLLNLTCSSETGLATDVSEPVQLFYTATFNTPLACVTGPTKSSSPIPSLPTLPTWNISSDFLGSPNQKNPNPSTVCCSPDVWYFQQVLGTDAPEQMIKYELTMGGNANLQAWEGTFYHTQQESMPCFAKNFGTTTINWFIPPGAVTSHPAPDADSLLTWKCPEIGTFTVRGSLRVIEGGGDGIRWSISSSRSMQPIASGSLPALSSVSFSSIPSVTLQSGDSLSLRINCNQNFGGDTTLIDFAVVAATSASSLATASTTVLQTSASSTRSVAASTAAASALSAATTSHEATTIATSATVTAASHVASTTTATATTTQESATIVASATASAASHVTSTAATTITTGQQQRNSPAMATTVLVLIVILLLLLLVFITGIVLWVLRNRMQLGYVFSPVTVPETSNEQATL